MHHRGSFQHLILSIDPLFLERDEIIPTVLFGGGAVYHAIAVSDRVCYFAVVY
jgi:hypothetical protein